MKTEKLGTQVQMLQNGKWNARISATTFQEVQISIRTFPGSGLK